MSLDRRWEAREWNLQNQISRTRGDKVEDSYVLPAAQINRRVECMLHQIGLILYLQYHIIARNFVFPGIPWKTGLDRNVWPFKLVVFWAKPLESHIFSLLHSHLRRHILTQPLNTFDGLCWCSQLLDLLMNLYSRLYTSLHNPIIVWLSTLSLTTHYSFNTLVWPVPCCSTSQSKGYEPTHSTPCHLSFHIWVTNTLHPRHNSHIPEVAFVVRIPFVAPPFWVSRIIRRSSPVWVTPYAFIARISRTPLFSVRLCWPPISHLLHCPHTYHFGLILMIFHGIQIGFCGWTSPFFQRRIFDIARHCLLWKFIGSPTGTRGCKVLPHFH